MAYVTINIHLYEGDTFQAAAGETVRWVWGADSRISIFGEDAEMRSLRDALNEYLGEGQFVRPQSEGSSVEDAAA
jgi:plastocyanin